MDNTTVFRLLYTHNQSAIMNMTIDKALASAFKKEDCPILRLYTWEKSFTVGVSQNLETYVHYHTLYKGNCAKRMTGGGVLFHGHDVSYSVVLPTHYLENLSVKQSYEKICSFLLAFYKNLNLMASYVKDIDTIELSKSDFCQVGYEAYDIIINRLKIGGNAQKRTKNMIFQHGSIPIFKGLNQTKEYGNSLEEVGVNLSFNETILQLKNAFSQTFNATLEDSVLNDKEQEYVKKLLKETHDSTHSKS